MSDFFDDIKRIVEGESNIKLVDTHRLGKDETVYNFTNRSEDDDFKTNLNTVPKSTTRRIVTRSFARQQNSKNVNLDSKYSSYPDFNIKKIKSKNSKCQKDKSQPSRRLSRELVDERMREATTDMLNTSSVMKLQIDELDTELEPINKKPRMMSSSDEEDYDIFKISDSPKKKREKKNTNPLPQKKKKATNKKLVTLDKTDDREVSPYPGLVVETAEAITTSNDSLPVTMIEKSTPVFTVSDNKGSDDKTTETVTEGTSGSHSMNNINIGSENTNESKPSGSGVNGLLQDNILREEANKDEYLDASVQECLSIFMKKLNTTIQESHNSTSKALEQLFEHTQVQLEQTQKKVVDMQEYTAKNVKANLVNMINEKFSHMNRRRKEEYDNINSDMKQKAAVLLRRELRQQKDLIKLLKEDIQSALGSIATRNNRS